MVFKKKSKANAKSKASVRSSETAVDASEDDPATSASETLSEDISTSKYRIQTSTEEDVEIEVKKGDIEAIKIILESEEFQKNGDINRMDINGYTVLHHAVIHQYEKVVELLLKQEGIFVFDTLYYAILEENVDIVQQLILFTSDNPESVDDAPDRDSDFPKSLTPFMLACTQGNLELIELFYKSGERLSWCPENDESLYHDKCACNMCTTSKGLEEDRNRLTLWQAFSNPVYISFMTGQVKGFDPVQEAFYLIGILRDEVIPNEVIFTLEYMELKENLEAFTVDLLDMCQSRYDTELMLKAEKDNKETTEPFPRLQWAMRLKHSDFVTHQHAQSMIYKWWVADGWPAWPSLHPVVKILHFLSRLVLFIPASILLLFDRESSLGKFFATPCNVFLNSLAAYVIFLMILIFQIVDPYQRCNTPANYKPEDECTEKGPPRVGTELIILIFVLGFIVSTVKHFWWSKKGFFRHKWNVFNIVTQVLFLMAFTFWGLAFIQWTATMDETNNVIPNEFRHTWQSTDPVLLGEACFGMATVLSFARLLQFCQVQSTYGPLQSGLGSMVHRALSTGIVFAYILIAFSAGLTGNYKGYMVEENDAVEVSDHYGDFWGAAHRLFFGFYASYEFDTLKIGLNTKAVGNETVEQKEHIANEFIGRSMIAIFQIGGYIIMMNMLIAFFSSAFGDIQDNVLKTWKYVRTEAFLFYGAETMLPSPFNLLMFFNFYYYSKCGKKSSIQAACNMQSCCYYKLRESKKEAATRKIQYLQLMKKFTIQYVDIVNERKAEELAIEDDIREIIEELDELRSLMKEKGLKTPEEEPVDETINQKFEEYQKSLAKEKGIIKHDVVPQFGTTVAAIKKLNNGDVVPPILRECVEFMSQPEALATEGIFRVNAKHSLLKEAFLKANEGGSVHFDNTEDNFYVAAGLITKFFRSLKVPLLTTGLYDEIVSLTKPTPNLDKKSIVKTIVKKLPADNRELLQFITEFFTKVTKQSSANKMDAKNLSIVLGPSFIWGEPPFENIPPDVIEAVQVNTGGVIFAEVLLTYPDEIFNESKTSTSQIEPTQAPSSDIPPSVAPPKAVSFASPPGSPRSGRRSAVQISSPAKSAPLINQPPTSSPSKAPVTAGPSKTASVSKQPSKPGMASPSAKPSVAVPPLPPKASSVVIQQPQGPSGLVTASPSASKETTIRASPSASK